MRTDLFAASAAPLPLRGEEPGERRLRRLSAFHPDHRRAIRDLTNGAVALEDLADSFPGLLFALATGYGDPYGRGRAFDMIAAGSPLRAVAVTLGLPWWLRKLPASAFADALVVLPADSDACLRFGSLVPTDPAFAGPWLQAVMEAQLAGGRDYALWMARHSTALLGAFSECRRMMLNAWVWSCAHPNTMAHTLVRQPWTPECGIKRVLEEFTAWSQRVALAEWLGAGRLRPWIEDGVVQGFRFITLRTADDYIAAAEALDNCLEQYADRLGTGLCTVASITRAGRMIACVEVAPHELERSMPAIVQLRGPRNRRAPLEVWQAAYAWIGARPVDAFTADRLVPVLTDQSEARFQIWQPYLVALARSPGGAAIEVRMRRHLVARHGAMGERRASRHSRRYLAAALDDHPAGLVRPPFRETVLQRLAELFPRGDHRRR